MQQLRIRLLVKRDGNDTCPLSNCVCCSQETAQEEAELLGYSSSGHVQGGEAGGQLGLQTLEGPLSFGIPSTFACYPR